MIKIRVHEGHVVGPMSMYASNCDISMVCGKFTLVILQMVCHASMYIVMSSV